MSNEPFRYGGLLQAYARYIGVAAVAYVVYLLPWFNGFQIGVERGVSSMLLGTSKVLTAITIPGRLVLFWWEGDERVARLEHRLSRAVVDSQELERLRRENGVLTRALGIQEKEYMRGSFLGTVVVRGDGGLAAFAHGTTGLAPGMVAVDEAGVLVGTVESVGGYLVKITQPFQKEVRIGVRVLGSFTTGLLVGNGATATLVEVLQEEPLIEGDTLVTSGVDGVFPEGLVVGQVSAVAQKPADVTKSGEVELLGKFDQLVFLLPDSEKTP